ncbi:MAG TPA: cation:proton antiporter [Candidatus Aenigmarchaeota archaeon]|nr:MAG: cation:proton antiporter [Candidatus Aenigmarchaeota archaeon]HDD46410.1 cation:proton antiporter [Candidatus Aenigmarchaeota archaeon]
MITAVAFLCAGIFFQTIGVIALYRFPDVYTRIHGTTMCTTLGSILFYIGISMYAFFSFNENWLAFTSHIFITLILLLITAPTGSHAIARAAYKSGIKPKVVFDKLRDAKCSK